RPSGADRADRARDHPQGARGDGLEPDQGRAGARPQALELAVQDEEVRPHEARRAGASMIARGLALAALLALALAAPAAAGQALDPPRETPPAKSPGDGAKPPTTTKDEKHDASTDPPKTSGELERKYKEADLAHGHALTELVNVDQQLKAIEADKTLGDL